MLALVASTLALPAKKQEEILAAVADEPIPSDKQLLQNLENFAVKGGPRPTKLDMQLLAVAFRKNMEAGAHGRHGRQAR